MTETTNEPSFAELFGAAESTVKEGEVVQGKILAIDNDLVQVDIGFKSEGVIASWEFMDDDGTILFKVGDPVDVLIEEAEDDLGRIVLSKEKAERLRVWDDISQAYEADQSVEGTIISRVKGGLSVDIGVKAFLPGSQVDLRPVRNLEGDDRRARPVQDHQVQQAARQHRALAARAARDRAPTSCARTRSSTLEPPVRSSMA